MLRPLPAEQELNIDVVQRLGLGMTLSILCRQKMIWFELQRNQHHGNRLRYICLLAHVLLPSIRRLALHFVGGEGRSMLGIYPG